MLVTAATIVAASVAAERAGPLLGGIIISLPVSAGPGYAFLARQASDAFIARSALYTFAATAATAAFLTVCIHLAPRHRALTTILAGLAVWVILAGLFQRIDLAWWSALLLNVASFGLCLWLTRDRAIPVSLPARALTFRDLLARAVLAGSLVAVVVAVSDLIGPRLTGSTITFPVTLTTLGLIMHWRHGGQATASILRGALAAMPCFAACMLALHLLTVPLGAIRALVAALGVSLLSSALFLVAGRLATGRRAAAPYRQTGATLPTTASSRES